MSSIEWRGWSRKAIVGVLAAAATVGVWWRRRRDAAAGAEGLGATAQADGEAARGAAADPASETARAGGGQ
jgi:hypothetical protein